MTRLKNDDQGRPIIMKSKSTALYTELIWNTEEFNDIKSRKIILCSSIWDNFVSDKYSYIKILYFSRLCKSQMREGKTF